MGHRRAARAERETVRQGHHATTRPAAPSRRDRFDLERRPFERRVVGRHVEAEAHRRRLHRIEESRAVHKIGEAIATSNCRVAVLASGSLSHRIHDNHVVDQGTFTISDEFYQQVDLRAIELWQRGAKRVK